jgi:uncharacterized protein
MSNQEIINKTIDFVKKTLANAEWAHDRWHIYRVRQLSKHINQQEQADQLVVELWALLHDIADAKFHNGDDTVWPRIAGEFLQSINIEPNIIQHVKNIISHISFGGGNFEQKFKSPELDIVQDADRLDGLGAIGIARTFNYGGHKGREIYNPDIKPNLTMTKEEYRKSTAPSLNHFYEKLLLLKERMNTKTGKIMAEHRHQFMEQFLNEFYAERNGEK